MNVTRSVSPSCLLISGTSNDDRGPVVGRSTIVEVGEAGAGTRTRTRRKSGESDTSKLLFLDNLVDLRSLTRFTFPVSNGEEESQVMCFVCSSVRQSSVMRFSIPQPSAPDGTPVDGGYTGLSRRTCLFGPSTRLYSVDSPTSSLKVFLPSHVSPRTSVEIWSSPLSFLE